MKLLIHDLEADVFGILFPLREGDVRVIADDGSIFPCIGCFGCWIKTPGACVIRDSYGDMGELLSKCDGLAIISRCVYGGFSPFIKNVLDRSISYLLPDFTLLEGEMHHKPRYDHTFSLDCWFYGEGIRDAEKSTAEKLVRANARNFYCQTRAVSFVDTPAQLRGKIS